MVNNVDKVDPRELQSLQLYLNEYRQQAEIFSQQLAILEEGRMEAAAAIDALKALLEAGESTVLLQLGGGASVPARVDHPEKILVNIGAEVVVERSNEEAVEFLKDRITEMEASSKKVSETLERVRGQIMEIGRRIEIGYQQAQMARMGQIGQVAAPDSEEE
jgi:prefoldin alpha subunit